MIWNFEQFIEREGKEGVVVVIIIIQSQKPKKVLCKIFWFNPVPTPSSEYRNQNSSKIAE